MQIFDINRYLLSIYAESVLKTFQVTAGLGFKCRFLVF